MIFFQEGFKIKNDTIIGNGLQYNMMRDVSTPVQKIAIDSIIYVQYYQEEQESQSVAFADAVVIQIIPIILIGIIFLIIV